MEDIANDSNGPRCTARCCVSIPDTTDRRFDKREKRQTRATRRGLQAIEKTRWSDAGLGLGKVETLKMVLGVSEWMGMEYMSVLCAQVRHGQANKATVQDSG